MLFREVSHSKSGYLFLCICKRFIFIFICCAATAWISKFSIYLVCCRRLTEENCQMLIKVVDTDVTVNLYR